MIHVLSLTDDTTFTLWHNRYLTISNFSSVGKVACTSFLQNMLWHIGMRFFHIFLWKGHRVMVGCIKALAVALEKRPYISDVHISLVPGEGQCFYDIIFPYLLHWSTKILYPISSWCQNQIHLPPQGESQAVHLLLRIALSLGHSNVFPRKRLFVHLAPISI